MPDGETEWEYTGERNQGTIHGYSGIAANFHPERFVRLCANFANRPDETNRERRGPRDKDRLHRSRQHHFRTPLRGGYHDAPSIGGLHLVADGH
jgi:hypothetical protein